MKASRQTLSLCLLVLFLGMGLAPFFGPPAAPLSTNKAQIVVLSEDKTHNFNEGFFRAGMRGEEEGVRADSFMAVISLEGFHENNCLVKLTKAAKQFNARAQRSNLYLLNSCLTI